MRVASIDIGTNSTRLLILSRNDQAALQTIDYQERMTKLGAGLSPQNQLSQTAMQRVIFALLEYNKILEQADVHLIQTFATSATRDAVNQQEFLNWIFTQTHLHCRVLDGIEEAEYSFLGAISDLQPKGSFLVCDIGGGSSEFIFAYNRDIIDAVSLNIGSGRLTRTLKQSLGISRAKKLVQQELENAFAKRSIDYIICTGGTAATLALMDLNTPISNPFAAHHHILNNTAIEKQITRLNKKSLQERQNITGLHPERAEVILGGAIIMQVILDFFKSPATISLRDLMYGIWLKEEIL